MATGGAARELCEELICPICLEYFEDPVTVAECGHNFCRACLTRCWGEAAAEASCPVCRGSAQPGSLRPNRQLVNIVEKARKLRLQLGEATKGKAGERSCEKHREPLKLFCRDDEVLICTVCDKSKEHKTHEVIPAEEAGQEYKDKIFNCLVALGTEKEKILVCVADAENESRKMLEEVESERQKTVAEFRTLHQLLDEQEKHQLAQIEEVEKEVAKKREEHLARLSEKLSSLEILIRGMEEKHQQPVTELLQDVRSTLQRYEKKEAFKNPESLSSELKWRLERCCYDPFLDCAMKQFKDTLPWMLSKLRAKVTLDPAAASSCLVLSGNQRCMTWQRTDRDLPEVPEKRYGFVLGSEGFTSGCHFWEVIVRSVGDWAVGVARKSVKGRVTLTPEKGIWAVGRWKGRYKAFIKGIDSPLTLSGELNWIQVCLNCARGRVAFFDAERAALLYEFSGASFSDGTLCPFFAVYDKSRLWLYP